MYRGFNNKWHYGAYLKHLPFTPYVTQEVKEEEYQHVILYEGFSDWGMPRIIDTKLVDAKSIGMWSGTYDKNNNKIYENDILLYDCEGKTYYYLVKYNEEIPQWLLYGINGILTGLNILNCFNDVTKNTIIVGNTFENYNQFSDFIIDVEIALKENSNS